MIAALRHLLGWLLSTLRSREDLILENLALRQQLLVLRSQRPRRRLATAHKLFWIALRGVWSGWKKPLVMVTPRTVVAWHRAGFRLYWRWLSRAKQVGGRKPVSKELRGLILRMAMENPTWGAPRIHGELLKLGFDVSEPTVSRWLRRVPRRPDPVQRWLTFLRNSSRSDCRHGLLYHPDAHLWCAVLLFRHRARPAQNSSLRRHAESHNPLDRTADAGSMAIRASTPVLVVRPRHEVWQQRGVVRERDGKPTYPHCLSQSVAKRGCGALGRELSTRLARSRDCLERAAPEAAVGRVCPLLP